MSHHLTNKTIRFPNSYGLLENNDYFTIYLISSNNNVHIALIDAPETEQWLVCGIVWLCFLIGSYFRYILYEYLFYQYKSNEFKPIAIMTLLIAVMGHLNTLLNVLYDTLITINNDSLENVSGGLWFCSVLIYTTAFAKMFSFAGGLMVAIYRILLIKHSSFVRVRIGLKNLFVVILIVGLSLTILGVVLDALNDYQHLRTERCVLSVSLMRSMAMTLDEYGQSLGTPSIYEYWRSVRIGLTFLAIAFIVSELTIYILYFDHMYRHDNSENLRRLLEPEVITRRNRTNAITFFTQFISFLAESTWILLVIITSLIGSHQNGLDFIRHIADTVTFASIAIIEVLLSSVLRPRVFIFKSNIIT